MSTAVHEDDSRVPDNVPSERVVDFDIFNPPQVENGLQEAWTELQAKQAHDLVWTPRNGGHWIPVRGELIKAISENHATFSNKVNFLPKEVGEDYEFIPAGMDPPEHQGYRKVLNDAVGPGIIRRSEPAIRQISKDLIAGLRDRGSCDFVKDYAAKFPVEVFLTLMDLPRTDGPRLSAITDQLTRPDGSMTFSEAQHALFEYVAPYIVERRANPGNDPISKAAVATIDGHPLTQGECERMCGLMLLAGLDTVVNFLSFMMQYLATHPDDRRYLIDNPKAVPAATEELLRRFGLVADARVVNGTAELDGVTLKDGDMVAIPTMLYGLDPSVTTCPMDVDLKRPKVEHLTFGHGVHRCAGAYLARVEIQTTLREWLANIPDFEIVPGEKVRHAAGIVGAVHNLPLRWNNG